MVLLDTHVWLWLQGEPRRVRREAMEILEDPDVDRLLSVASTWEISIKYALGKLSLPEAPRRHFERRMRLGGVRSLSVEHRHALEVADLPHHHADPFDRMIIAQARVEGLPIVTADPRFAPYDVELIAAA
jgi:PIN domain nuclease of toxin-antitoxin system